MSDGDRNIDITEGTLSITLETSGSYATMKNVLHEKELFTTQMTPVLIYNLSR